MSRGGCNENHFSRPWLMDYLKLYLGVKLGVLVFVITKTKTLKIQAIDFIWSRIMTPHRLIRHIIIRPFRFFECKVIFTVNLRGLSFRDSWLRKLRPRAHKTHWSHCNCNRRLIFSSETFSQLGATEISLAIKFHATTPIGVTWMCHASTGNCIC